MSGGGGAKTHTRNVAPEPVDSSVEALRVCLPRINRGARLPAPEAMSRRKRIRHWRDFLEAARQSFLEIGPFVLFDTSGGRDELRRVVAAEFQDLVDQIQAVQPPPGAFRVCVDPGSGAVWRRMARLLTNSASCWQRARADRAIEEPRVIDRT